LLLILSAFAVSFIPLIQLPFIWIETFFHEISHGLAAIFTGGSIVKISLKETGAGSCKYNVGAIEWLVIFSGYMGAIIWGMFIYLGASYSAKKANQFGIGIAIFIAISGMLWAKDSETWVILIAIISVLLISLWLVSVLVLHRRPVQVFVQFIGIFILVNTIKSLMQLLAIPDVGDHVELAKITIFSEYIWWLIWIIGSVIALWYLWLKSYNDV